MIASAPRRSEYLSAQELDFTRQYRKRVHAAFSGELCLPAVSVFSTFPQILPQLCAVTISPSISFLPVIVFRPAVARSNSRSAGTPPLSVFHAARSSRNRQSDSLSTPDEFSAGKPSQCSTHRRRLEGINYCDYYVKSIFWTREYYRPLVLTPQGRWPRGRVLPL